MGMIMNEWKFHLFQVICPKQGPKVRGTPQLVWCELRSRNRAQHILLLITTHQGRTAGSPKPGAPCALEMAVVTA